MIMGAWGMGGKKAPTAKDYVQDGLISMWDGIENAGWGTHDASATVWKNLTGDTAWDMEVPSSWQNNGLYFDGTWCAKAPKTSLMFASVECVCDSAVDNFPLSFGWSLQYAYKRYSLLIRRDAQLLRCYVGGATLDGVFSGVAQSFAIAIGETASIIFVDGSQNAKSTSAVGVFGETANRFRLGGYGTTSDTDASGFFYKGHVRRCSIYSRALTVEEIAANYTIDKQRFNLP